MTEKSKLDKVLDFYGDQLEDLSLVVVGDGMVSMRRDKDELRPVTISGSRLCLPTNELLRQADWTGKVVFHPLSEQFNTNLSPIANAMKNYIQAGLTARIFLLVREMSNLIADTSKHNKLNAKMSKVLKSIGHFDDKTAAVVRSITKKVGDAPETRLVNILMKNGDNGDSLRNTVITFPIAEGLTEAAKNGLSEFMGVKNIRKTDMPAVANLFNYVCGEKVYGKSSNRTAPYYHSLLLAWKEIAEHLNSIIELFGSKVPAIEAIDTFELNWVEVLNDFDAFASKHHAVAPVLSGNRPITEDNADIANNQMDKVASLDNIPLAAPVAPVAPAHSSVNEQVPWHTAPATPAPQVNGSVSISSYGRQDQPFNNQPPQYNQPQDYGSQNRFLQQQQFGQQQPQQFGQQQQSNNRFLQNGPGQRPTVSISSYR